MLFKQLIKVFFSQSLREIATDEPLFPKKRRQIRNELTKDEKNTHRKQKCRQLWENNVDFKGWLKGDNNDSYRAKSIKYQVSFISELTSIKNHAKSMNHKNAVKITTLGSQSFMS